MKRVCAFTILDQTKFIVELKQLGHYVQVAFQCYWGVTLLVQVLGPLQAATHIPPRPFCHCKWPFSDAKIFVM